MKIATDILVDLTRFSQDYVVALHALRVLAYIYLKNKSKSNR